MATTELTVHVRGAKNAKRLARILMPFVRCHLIPKQTAAGWIENRLQIRVGNGKWERLSQ